jgi:hypothetical protein
MKGGMAAAWHTGEGGGFRPAVGAQTRQVQRRAHVALLGGRAEKGGGVRCMELHVGRPGEKETAILGWLVWPNELYHF